MIPLLGSSSVEGQNGRKFFLGMLRNSGIFVQPQAQIVLMSLSEFPRSAICRYCAAMTLRARQVGATHYVLLGDDVELKTPFWMREISVAFREFETKYQAPSGFGCVGFSDESFPGFPTFPVVTWRHLDMFDNSLFPDCFINQDGDPFLFQLYRRWNCSVLLPHVRLANLIGGPNDARYTKQHADKWTVKPLNDYVETVAIYLQKHGYTECKRVITLNVIIPTFQCQLEYLTRILELD